MAIKRAPPEDMTRRAKYFIQNHGHWTDHADIKEYRARWLEHGIPEAQIDRVAAYEAAWGGLVLPPSPRYDGGPRTLSGDVPQGPTPVGYFEAGAQRTALPYLFMIGPGGEFGLHAGNWVPLYAGVEGWVEALAQVDHARRNARATRTLTGDAVDGLELEGFEAVVEVAGLADTWWQGADLLVAVYRGEAEVMDAPQCRTATIYSRLDEWGPRGLSS